ncbi:MAG: Mth938-like domain-containing protein [Pseudomonadota bacterium]
MQLTLETPGSANVITAMERNRIKIGGQWLTGNLIVSADTLEPDWPATSAETLEWPHLEPLVAMEPEIILIGTGAALRFPPAALSADVLGRGIGFEVMDTAAACRTYNILVTEQRRVVAGILQPTN